MTDNEQAMDEILAACIEGIEDERWTVEDCLARYANHRDELQPMLRVALELRAARSVRTSDAFRRKAPARLKLRLVASQRPPHTGLVTESASLRSRLRNRIPNRLRRLPMLPTLVSLVLVFAISMGGVVAVADAAGPGDLLFGVDLAVEELRLRLTTDEETEVKLRVEFASERIAEAEFELAAEGDLRDIEEALAAFDAAIAGLQPLLDGLTPEQQAIIQEVIDSLSADRQAIVRLEIRIEDGELELEFESESEDGEEDDADLEEEDDGDEIDDEDDDLDDELENQDEDELEDGEEACEAAEEGDDEAEGGDDSVGEEDGDGDESDGEENGDGDHSDGEEDTDTDEVGEDGNECGDEDDDNEDDEHEDVEDVD